MKKDQPEKNSNRRALWIALLLITWMIAIIWKMAWLQIVRHDHYVDLAGRNQRREIQLTPARGEILDREGKPLAYSIITDSLFADLKLLKDGRDRARAAAALSPLLGMNGDELARRLSGNSSFVWLRRKLDPVVSEEIKRVIAREKLSGISVRKEDHRFYPHETLAAHLIGYVGLDDKGLEGLELTHDAFLRGRPGEVWLQKDGRNIAFNRSEIPALTGAQIVTTIDIPLQLKVEILLDEAMKMTRAKGISAIVMEPSTGEIIALANAPTFDPNQRPKSASDRVRHNRAISYPFEPGSVFKIIAYTAAFEEGLLGPDDELNCGNGEIRFGKRIIHDTRAYGRLTAADAFAKSSNVCAIRVAQKVGREKFFEYIKRFGFGEKTGIELPGESKGLVNALERWRPDSIGSVAIGQEISVTLVQAASAMATIANSGLRVQPHLVRKIVTADERILYQAEPKSERIISEQTAGKMSLILQRVVTSGTARRAIQLTGYTAAGKTGTPQKVDEATRAYSKTKYMPTFAGFVPAAEPKFVIVVMVDEPVGLYHGGSVAAPIFKMIAEAALGDFLVMPDEKGFREMLVKLSKKYEAETAADETGSSGESSASTAGGPEAIPPASDQTPAVSVTGVSANLAPSMSPVRMPAGFAGGSIIMPDFRGQNVRSVLELATRLRLDVRLQGSGIARRQSPRPGTPVRPGDECRVEFIRSENP